MRALSLRLSGRGRGAASRPDPAPSRWSWRLQRLLLTPAFRLALRVVLPAAISAGAVHLYMSDVDRRDTVVSTLYEWRQAFQNRPQFMVNVMEIGGVSGSTEADIREIAELDLPRSSFDLDLVALKESIESLPSVARAAVQVRNGGVLFVLVEERVPVAIWRGPDGFDLVDIHGEVTGAVYSRLDRPDLPVLAADTAPEQVEQALRILAAAEPVRERMRGLERMGGRRWDVVLDRGQRIMLPETQPVQALERVLALHQAEDLLSRDVLAVDMRLAARPTVRLVPEAVGEWRKLKELVVETGQ